MTTSTYLPASLLALVLVATSCPYAAAQAKGVLDGHKGNVRCLEFSPDGQTLAVGSLGEITLWDWSRRRVRTVFRKDKSEVQSLAFSPDAKWLAAGAEDGTTTIWEVSSGKVRRTFKIEDQSINSVAFSPDGKVLAATGHTHLKLWNLEGKELGALALAMVNCLAFSPDGKRLVVGSDIRGAQVWDSSLQRHTTLETQSVYSVAFSPDGKMLAMGTGEGTYLWEATTGKLRTVLERLNDFQGEAW
jgi:WD40 repeat protein